VITHNGMDLVKAVVYQRIFSGWGGGGVNNSVEDTGQKERGSGCSIAPLVRGSVQFANC
jgi:hypothetical protein